MKRALAYLAVAAVVCALAEVYAALRPAHLEDELGEYLTTAAGRFDEFYARRSRGV